MFSYLFGSGSALPTAEEALPGRPDPLPGVGDVHAVLGTSLRAAPPGAAVGVFGLGCFWGAERAFWQLPGVLSTSVGYAAGHTPNPTYQEVCSGRTAHAEVVRVVFDPARVTYESLCRTFFELHDPTQGMRQGHDEGTQYRSVILTVDDAQRAVAERIREVYARALGASGHRDPITTEIAPLGPYYLAEDYHQQYLAKNPGGYCGIGGTGVRCPAASEVG